MTNEESRLLSEISAWRQCSVDNPINEAVSRLRDLPKGEPEAQDIIDRLITLHSEAKLVSEKIIDRKLRELRILGMK